MTDSLRTRVARVIATSAHALLDKIEDAAPVALLAQSLRELDHVTDDVRAELGRAAVNRHLTQQQHRHLNTEHDGLADALSTALGSGRDDLAQVAIARQLDIEVQLPVLESSLSELTQTEQELATFVEALMGKRREMERAIRDLEAAVQRAPVGANHRPSTTHMAQAQAVQQSFDRTYQRQTGLQVTAQGATLEQATSLGELSEMVRASKISERLNALKAAL